MMRGDDFACRPVNGGWSPVIYFKGERYQWASVYEDAKAASSVAQQLLASAVKHGRVP